MTAEPGDSTPPAPDPPNLAPGGRWGVPPSASPQMTRSAGKSRTFPLLGWALAALIVAVAVLIVMLVLG